MEQRYNYGRTLSDILASKKIKPIRLSENTGISKSYLSQIINGKKNPDIDTLESICSSLNISLSSFLLLSINLDGDDERKNRLLKKIQPILLEIDELIYPEKGSSIKRSPQIPSGLIESQKRDKKLQSV